MRLRREEGSSILLIPEGAMFLNDSAAAIAALLDGTRTVPDIVEALSGQFECERSAVANDVEEFLGTMRARGFVTT